MLKKIRAKIEEKKKKVNENFYVKFNIYYAIYIREKKIYRMLLAAVCASFCKIRQVFQKDIEKYPKAI